MLKIRAAAVGDASELAPMLRYEDLREIRATIGWEPKSVLEYGIVNSTVCYTVTDDMEQPLAIFGVEPDPATDTSGIVWLLGSEYMIKHRFYILRNSHQWIQKLHNVFPRLWNYIDARNEVYIKWLRWCGFRFIETLPNFGIEKRVFHRFERFQRPR